MNMLQPIGHWWQQRSQQEHFILGVGGLFVLVIIVYFGIASPLQTQVQTVQKEWQSNRQLLSWMQPRVQALQGQQSVTQASQAISASALLVTVDQSVKQTAFANTVTELSQSSNNGVQIRFKAVPVDALLQWLAMLHTKYQVDVLQFSAQPNATLGMADVVLTVALKK